MNSAMSAWEATTVGEVCEKPRYGFTASAQTRNTGTRFLRITDLREGSLNWNEVPFCHCRKNEIDRYQLQNGDLVVARIGATTGRTSLALSPPRAVFASYLIRLRPKTDINSFFLYFFTQSSAYWNSINSNKDSNLKGGVNAGVLTRLEFPKPPLAEQEKIAAVLWKIQKAVEIEDAIVRNARDLKKSLLRQLFTHGLRGDGSTELDGRKVPGNWRVCRFSDFATLHRGYDLPVQNRMTGTVPIVGSNGIVGYHSVAKFKGPGVATGRSGTMGLSFYVESEYWPLNTALYVADFHGNEPLFVHYFFQSFDFDLYSAGVSVPTLNRNLVHEAMIAVPDRDEQREIVGILQTVDRKIDIHESKKRSLQDLFRTMLHKLMTAQIRVNPLEIDTSEVSA